MFGVLEGKEMDIKQHWDNLHNDPRFRPMYPHDRVVAWAFRNFPRNQAHNFRLLDLGCGAGRHSVFLAREGYRVAACDFSAAGLNEARHRADEAGVEIETVLCEADHLNFADQSFDGVLCFGVIYYLPYERFLGAAKEIHRVLKPGGKALVVTRTRKDSRCDKTRRIARATYVLPEFNATAPSRAEDGMIMTFVGKREIQLAFGGFSSITIDRSTITSGGGVFVDDDWYIFAVR